MTTVTTTTPPAPPLLRLRLAAPGVLPRRLDGAWWPRSRDLLAELPLLLAALPRVWGHIASITVDPGAWTAAPGRMFVANQVVRLHRATALHPPSTVVLLAPGHGRWDLFVVPPDTADADAEPLMAAALSDYGARTRAVPR
ncbi:DUF5994 family protein [Streptomyces aureocirculatus]|uniref:DUF5994 family protein n=1 Tax=Streptomyces aureocirculatus TaxID=67275 RepID=UPI0004C9CAEE|nr:DUF5994 family protein [Streptomyces aureocirculatus]